ncbi:MAG: hypothetical protein EPN20_11970 [Magnetospirillum sp.]|nr:MAG: hypothetical protein EPN20_11970 [Magnetospirillum sp.]
MPNNPNLEEIRSMGLDKSNPSYEGSVKFKGRNVTSDTYLHMPDGSDLVKGAAVSAATGMVVAGSVSAVKSGAAEVAATAVKESVQQAGGLAAHMVSSAVAVGAPVAEQAAHAARLAAAGGKELLSGAAKDAAGQALHAAGSAVTQAAAAIPGAGDVVVQGANEMAAKALVEGIAQQAGSVSHTATGHLIMNSAQASGATALNMAKEAAGGLAANADSALSVFRETAGAKLMAAATALGSSVDAALAGGAFAATTATAIWLAKRAERLKSYADIGRASPWLLTPKELGQVAKRLYNVQRSTDANGRHRAVLTDKASGQVLASVEGKDRPGLRSLLLAHHKALVAEAERGGIPVPGRVKAALVQEARRVRNPERIEVLQAQAAGKVEAFGRSLAQMTGGGTKPLVALAPPPGLPSDAVAARLKALSPAAIDTVLAGSIMNMERNLQHRPDQAAAFGRGVKALGQEIERRIGAQVKTASRNKGMEL